MGGMASLAASSSSHHSSGPGSSPGGGVMRSRADCPGTAELVQQLGDGADPDALVALGRAEALGVQPPCDGLGAVALLRQLADPVDQLRVGAELLEAGDGADGLAAGGVPASPGDLYGHAFAGARHGDGHLLHHGADELLAVGVGGGRRSPQGFDVAGEGGDGLPLRGGERLGRVRVQRS